MDVLQAVQVIIDKFIPFRGLVPRGLTDERRTPDHIMGELGRLGYFLVDCHPAAKPDGGVTTILVIEPSLRNQYMVHAPNLRSLLDSVTHEKETREVIVVASDEFHAKSNLTTVIRTRQLAEATGPRIRHSLYRLKTFAMNVLEHALVPKHQILSPEEGAALLKADHIDFASLPVIFTTDPPLVWLGARGGEVIKIVRDSPLAGSAIYLRRSVRLLAGPTKSPR